MSATCSKSFLPDLSVTSWMLMFMRSAKNAGFKVSAKDVDAALAFVIRVFDRTQGAFRYSRNTFSGRARPAMVGAGILSLSLAGRHNTTMARSAGQWLLARPFTSYNTGSIRRYHYSVFYSSMAMFHLGGRYWKEFYPRTADTLVRHQHADGSYEPESRKDGYFGNAYTTSLAVLALTVPNQMLPITQR